MRSSKKEINFRDRDLLFIDLETTGLDITKHEIIEIACILVDGKTLKEKKSFSSRVKPINIGLADKKALKICGYSEIEWKDAGNIVDTLKKIAGFAPEAMVAGWKVDFDWNMLAINLQKYGIKHNFDYHLIDVVSLAYLFFREKHKPQGLSLRKVAPFFGFKLGKIHNAKDDIETTYKIFKKIANLVEL